MDKHTILAVFTVRSEKDGLIASDILKHKLNTMLGEHVDDAGSVIIDSIGVQGTQRIGYTIRTKGFPPIYPRMDDPDTATGDLSKAVRFATHNEAERFLLTWVAESGGDESEWVIDDIIINVTEPAFL